MTTQHTPGPWHLGMKPGPMIYGADSSQVADLRGDLLDKGEALANARLIAAAPDLLAALIHARTMVFAMTGDDAACAPWNAMLPQIDAAIARATA